MLFEEGTFSDRIRGKGKSRKYFCTFKQLGGSAFDDAQRREGETHLGEPESRDDCVHEKQAPLYLSS